MSNYTKFVGLDVHKKDIVVALKIVGEEKKIEFKVSHTDKGLKKLLRKLKGHGLEKMLSCYEAGFCGFSLWRKLEKLGLDCKVIAPSLIPIKPGERIKTDKRDAKKLADLLSADLLTEVHPISEEEESVRALTRSRASVIKDIHRAKHRVLKFLHKLGIVWDGKSNWTQAHWLWLKSLQLDGLSQVVIDDLLLAIEQLEERCKNLEVGIQDVSEKEPYKKRVDWLKCFRGIDTITAMTIITELYSFERFHSPRQLMSYVGLVPSESSSGDRENRGNITKAGNKHLRKILIQTAQHCAKRPAIGKTLQGRRKGQPARVIAIADKAMSRLYRKFLRLTVKYNKHRNKGIVAVARELLGFIWAVLYPDCCDDPLSGEKETLLQTNNKKMY